MSEAVRATLRAKALAAALTVLLAPALSPAVAAATAAPVTSASVDAAASAPAARSSVDARATAIFQIITDYWTREFVTLKAQYQPGSLSIYTSSLPNACGAGGAVVGPFYCPDDSRVYLPRAYLQQVVGRAGRSGDLALAYVIGHEVGKHIQDLIGTTEKVEQARARSTAELSARTWAVAELQADCYAGLAIRAVLAQRRIAAGDASLALQAVAGVTSAMQAHLAHGEVMPDPLQTYLVPAQRLQWLQRGLSSGEFTACDTFSAEAAGKL